MVLHVGPEQDPFNRWGSRERENRRKPKMSRTHLDEIVDEELRKRTAWLGDGPIEPDPVALRIAERSFRRDRKPVMRIEHGSGVGGSARDQIR